MSAGAYRDFHKSQNELDAEQIRGIAAEAERARRREAGRAFMIRKGFFSSDSPQSLYGAWMSMAPQDRTTCIFEGGLPPLQIAEDIGCVALQTPDGFMVKSPGFFVTSFGY